MIADRSDYLEGQLKSHQRVKEVVKLAWDFLKRFEFMGVKAERLEDWVTKSEIRAAIKITESTPQ